MELRPHFLHLLKSADNDISKVYYMLFIMAPSDTVEYQLNDMFYTYRGLDTHFGESRKTEWFRLFHKMLRQADFFEECYKRDHQELLSKEQRSRYKYLISIVRAEGYNKHNEDQTVSLFTPEYSEYLNFRQLVKREAIYEPINGHLDMILYNLIHIDEEGVLRSIFVRLFEDILRGTDLKGV